MINFIDKRWTDEQSKYLLDKYFEYSPLVGPMRRFKTKKIMWEKISSKMMEFGWEKTPIQVENRYKTIMKNKKLAVDNNKRTGTSRCDVLFENEINKIVAIDDSIQPEYTLSSIGNENKKPAESSNVLKKRKTSSASLADTLIKIHEEKEKNKKARHQEKMNFLKEIFKTRNEDEI